MRRVAGLSVLLSAFLSCSLIGGRAVRSEYIRSEYRQHIRNAVFVLDEIDADLGAESSRVRENGEYALRVIFQRRLEKVSVPGGRLTAKVRLKQDTFMRDYRYIQTVTAEISLYQENSGEPVAFSLYTEDTGETLSSYAYLYRLLEKAVGRFR